MTKAWKSVTSRRIRGGGALWAPDYFDRLVRGGDHFDRAQAYIHANPVRAGLAAEAQAWPWSSAHTRWDARLAWSPELSRHLSSPGG